MHTFDSSILHNCIVVCLMKKKPHEHPKLFLNFTIDNNIVYLLFKQNQFNDNMERTVLKEKINENINVHKEELLTNLNKYEYEKLKKYIKVQKRVLVKHQKNRNYDSVRVVNYSLRSM